MARTLPLTHTRPTPDLDCSSRLGCRLCGLPAAEHGPTLMHRFVRPPAVAADGAPAAVGTDGARAA